jgi:2-methylcitrate dehydratase PrpD
MAATLSRRMTKFAEVLTFHDLPDEVVDKAKACLLHNTASAIHGMTTAIGRDVARLVLVEQMATGSRVLGGSIRHAPGAAAFANSAFMNVTNQSDSYYMLTHPGPCVLPAALAVADLNGSSGRDLITAIVAGYEVQSWLAKDLLPTTQAQGFRSAPVFGVLGAAVAASKMLGHDATTMHHALALAATSASGTLESATVRTSEHVFHEPIATRNAVQAAIYAPALPSSADTCIEGDFGFLNAYVGNNEGELRYRFDGEGGKVDLATSLDAMGERFAILDVAFKSYPTPGYNNPVAYLLLRMLCDHPIEPEGISEVAIELNWLEVSYPTPARPSRLLRERRPGTTYFVAAYVLATGQPPSYAGSRARAELPDLAAELMDRTSISGSPERPYFTPRITIRMKDGRVIQEELTGRELKVGFEECVVRLDDMNIPAVGAESLASATAAVRNLDDADNLDEYFSSCDVLRSAIEAGAGSDSGSSARSD